MFIWSTIQLVVTIFILFFVKEKNDASVASEDKIKDEEEFQPRIGEIGFIFKDLLTNPNTIRWFSYMTLANCVSAISNSIFEVYLTNELGMPKENLSMMKVLFTPLNILLAFFSSYFAAKTPFYGVRLANIAEIFLYTYGIFVILGCFP